MKARQFILVAAALAASPVFAAGPANGEGTSLIDLGAYVRALPSNPAAPRAELARAPAYASIYDELAANQRRDSAAPGARAAQPDAAPAAGLAGDGEDLYARISAFQKGVAPL